VNNKPDPLARFRHIQKNATSDDPLGLDVSGKYVAFEVGDRSQERLQIRRVLNITHSPSYRYLMDIMSNPGGTQIILVYSFLMVKIKGSNLQPLTKALEDGVCTFIQDYHANEYLAPDPKDPFIESIEVKVRQDSSMEFDKDEEKGE